jgi:hypothetical protein
MAKRFVSRVRTSLSLEELQALVAKHCRGQAEVFFEGVENGFKPRKIMRIEFANEGDQLLFRVAWTAKASD